MKKVIIGQTLGGLFFFIFGGQPLMVLLTTAPLAIYIKSESSPPNSRSAALIGASNAVPPVSMLPREESQRAPIPPVRLRALIRAVGRIHLPALV